MIQKDTQIKVKNKYGGMVGYKVEELGINRKFYPNETKEVTIGRDKNCNFAFPKDKSFSRHQTTFSYDDNNKEWTILDGMKDKASTNGTWVFGTHSFIVKNQMIVEILNSKLKFILKENDI